MKKDVFTPLNLGNTKRITTTLELPFDLENRVGINTQFIEFLMQLGGVRTLKILNEKSGKTTKVMPQIIGMNSNGTALGGGVAVEKIPTWDWESDMEFGGNYKQSRWIDLDIKLNTAEMTERIRQRDQDVRNAVQWATEVNEGLKKSIVNAGVNHLFTDFDTFDKVFTAFFYINDFLLTLAESTNISVISPQFLLTLLLNYMKTGLIMSGLNTITRPEKIGDGRRLSLFYGFEADRALVLAIAAEVKKFAQEVPVSE